MFRSTRYRHALFSILLALAAVSAGWLFAAGHWWWGWGAVGVAAVSLRLLSRSFKKFNSNIIFLLNALENSDYSFHFSDTGTSKDNKEINEVLNAIKEILVKAREQEIENERFLSLSVASIPVGIVVIDERDFVKEANEAALRLLGLRVFTHLKQLEMVDKAVSRTLRTLAPGRTATVRVADEKEERLISLSMSEIKFRKGTLRVVTMNNIAGEIEAGEMESWIKLIRVMTHEIMNSIAPITSLGETMLTAWRTDDGRNADGEFSYAEKIESLYEVDRLRRNTVEAFETIISTARGLSSFVESYRRFTGIPKPNPDEIGLPGLVRRVTGLETPAFRERGIGVEVEEADPSLTVMADEGQITQVLVNLLKNAAEAIPPGSADGRIGVSVRRSGEGVRVDVANNGTPIPPEVLPHIFVPFFTTKSSGTGIGLSVSRYIMRMHGGNLKHHTSDGRTVFSMVFPPMSE